MKSLTPLSARVTQLSAIADHIEALDQIETFRKSMLSEKNKFSVPGVLCGIHGNQTCDVYIPKLGICTTMKLSSNDSLIEFTYPEYVTVIISHTDSELHIHCTRSQPSKVDDLWKYIHADH